MTDLLWLLVSLAIIAGLVWLARRIEPHWAAKDGGAFTCKVRELDPVGNAETRWREARAVIEGDRVSIERKVLGRPGKQRDARAVMGRASTGPNGTAVFVLDGEPLLAIRVPVRSPAVDRLAAIVHEI